MNTKYIEAQDLIAKARDALRRGDKPTAWKLGEQAALLVPDMEDAWLILAASDANPEEALAYAQKALALKPLSPRAQKAVEWTKAQIKPIPVTKESAVAVVGLKPVLPQTIEPLEEAPQPKSDPPIENGSMQRDFLAC